MTTLQRALVAATMISYAAPPQAADNRANEVAVARDLAAVIALQGLPCGNVVSVAQRGTDDYVASCQDGNRYQVFVDADGRVVVKKVD